MRSRARDRNDHERNPILPGASAPSSGDHDDESDAGGGASRAWRTYVGFVSVVGIGLVPFVLATPNVRVALGSGGFWLFSAFVLLGELFPLRVQMRDELTENTTSVTFTLALVFSYGVGAAVLPNVISSAIGDIRQRKNVMRILFNVGQYTLSITACGAVYRRLGGGGAITPRDIPPLVLSAAVMFLVNEVLTSVAVGLWFRVPLVPYVWRNLLFSAYMTPALLALSPIVVLVADVSLWFVPLFAIPIVAVYWGMTKALENSRLVVRLRGSLEHMTELNRMKDDFVAVVSHELRTPLTSIQGYIKTLLQLSGELDRDMQVSFLEAADRQSDRLRRLIEQLLAVARLESHVEPLAVKPVSITAVVEAVAEELRTRANGHTFDLRPTAGVADVRTDEGKVHQIVSNLVENALKYSPPDTRITIRVEPGVGGTLIAVEDEGPGIPSESQDQVFERFFQVDQSATREVGGAGLGLYICRKMAEAIGARIWLDRSTPGGSVFCLFVPQSPPEDEVREPPGAEEPPQSMTARV
jgi:signal transduction histidine kinase